MKMIENRTKFGNRACITFKKQIDEKNFLEICNGNGCDSCKGKLKEEISQKLNLNRRLPVRSYPGETLYGILRDL
jgi:hypothetical protein